MKKLLSMTLVIASAAAWCDTAEEINKRISSGDVSSLDSPSADDVEARATAKKSEDITHAEITFMTHRLIGGKGQKSKIEKSLRDAAKLSPDTAVKNASRRGLLATVADREDVSSILRSGRVNQTVFNGAYLASRRLSDPTIVAESCDMALTNGVYGVAYQKWFLSRSATMTKNDKCAAIRQELNALAQADSMDPKAVAWGRRLLLLLEITQVAQ